MNIIGKAFRLTTFGESHGLAVGGVIDGCPSQLKIDLQQIAEELARRATGSTSSASQRKEADEVEFLSGLLDGVTLGTPISFLVRNTDARPEDYADLKETFRPFHADSTYQAKYGIRDWRGGGRASARTTVPVVVAGAIAKQILASQGIVVHGAVHSIGGLTDPAGIEALLQTCREQGDTVGGIVQATVTGLPAGLGEPMFDKVQASLSKAMFSIPAVKGFEYGDGFAAASMRGSELRATGGALGGITDGSNLDFKVAFKPIPTLGRGQRHDVCALPRAVVIVEAMAALTLVDFILG